MNPAATRIIGLREVLSRTSMSRSTVYLLQKNGEFPKSVSITERRVGFVESEIDDWLNAKIASGRKAA
jgi:prophage regulatory protein